MSRPRCLDLFCCGGGASVGYARAGFDVVGVDIEPQPNYPFRFIQGDALEYLALQPKGFDLIHASPPCQGYSPHVSSRSSQWVPTKGADEPRLIEAVRNLVSSIGCDWVIENVMGARAHMNATLILSGQMFGLPIQRKRLFESNVLIPQPTDRADAETPKAFAEARGWEYRDMSVTGKGRRAGTSDRWKEIMGIDWPMSQHQLAEAIPPAYTEYIGKQILLAKFPAQENRQIQEMAT